MELSFSINSSAAPSLEASCSDIAIPDSVASADKVAANKVSIVPAMDEEDVYDMSEEQLEAAMNRRLGTSHVERIRCLSRQSSSLHNTIGLRRYDQDTTRGIVSNIAKDAIESIKTFTMANMHAATQDLAQHLQALEVLKNGAWNSSLPKSIDTLYPILIDVAFVYGPDLFHGIIARHIEELGPMSPAIKEYYEKKMKEIETRRECFAFLKESSKKIADAIIESDYKASIIGELLYITRKRTMERVGVSKDGSSQRFDEVLSKICAESAIASKGKRGVVLSDAKLKTELADIILTRYTFDQRFIERVVSEVSAVEAIMKFIEGK